MTFFGENVYLLAKELNMPIKTIGRYAVTSNRSVTLYDSDMINSFMNINKDFMKYYNAWMFVPGCYIYYYNGFKVTIIQGEELEYPNIGAGIGKDLATAGDIFTFIKAKLPQKDNDWTKGQWFNMLYTMSVLNKFTLEDFMEKFAKRW
jgi:hypothetical protein